MKKVFQLKDPNHKPERQLDTIRHEIKKYILRERRKSLPEDVDYWDFDCKFGRTVEQANPIKVSEIKAKISEVAANKESSFYLEILAKPGYKIKSDSK